MELTERKRKILYAIIQNYQETGEPVGSRTISKYLDVKLSPATIRNEMSDLEEMELITQPHTSAGRIPTDKGYRLYVDTMLTERLKAAEQLPMEQNSDSDPSYLLKRVDRVEELLMKMAKILAANTNYATMITGPRYKTNKLKFTQLSPMGEGKLLCVIVTEGDMVKNNIMDVGEELSQETILNLNLLLNQKLNGLTIEDINLDIITQLKSEAGEHSDIISKVLDMVADAIRGDDKIPIYTSGAPNIFKYPELIGGGSASELISTFEEKDSLGSIVRQSDEEGKHDIQVYIGDEVPIDSMKNCSVITANYELGKGIQGKIGIIGPKRMDYQKVVETLNNTMMQLDDIFDEDEQE